jgi:hypothetical protein
MSELFENKLFRLEIETMANLNSPGREAWKRQVTAEGQLSYSKIEACESDSRN